MGLLEYIAVKGIHFVYFKQVVEVFPMVVFGIVYRKDRLKGCHFVPILGAM